MVPFEKDIVQSDAQRGGRPRGGRARAPAGDEPVESHQSDPR